MDHTTSFTDTSINSLTPLSVRDLMYSKRNPFPFSDDYFLLGHLGLPLSDTSQISPEGFQEEESMGKKN